MLRWDESIKVEVGVELRSVNMKKDVSILAEGGLGLKLENMRMAVFSVVEVGAVHR